MLFTSRCQVKKRKLATVNSKEVCDPDYEIYINGLQLEFKNIASDRTKRVACFLTKALREFFKVVVPECSSS